MKTQEPTKPRFQHSADTRAGKQERAVAVFLDPHGFVQQKWEFLHQKGMSDNEILEALNTATGGELIRAAAIEIIPRESPISPGSPAA
jgi:hypothetical protein